MQSKFVRRISLAIMFLVMQGCSSTVYDFLAQGLVMADRDGTYAVASVTQGDVDIIDAVVTVGNTQLSYGLPLQFSTDTGLLVDVLIPIYYAGLPNDGPNSTVWFNAIVGADTVVYQYQEITIPAQVDLTEPVDGQNFDVNQDIAMQWTDAGAQGYLASYSGDVDDDAAEDENVGDDGQEYEGDDPGLFLTYLPTEATGTTVPASSTVTGDAYFEIDALKGDTDIFITEDTDRSFFLVGSADWADGTIADATAAAGTVSKADAYGSQGLSVVKEYSKKVEGLRFKVREGDPQQIIQPGTVQVGFKMRRYKVSVAFVKAYDINGNEYFSWIKKRIYKSKKKKYYPTFSVSPGTTVVFGTHDASYRGGTYSY